VQGVASPRRDVRDPHLDKGREEHGPHGADLDVGQTSQPAAGERDGAEQRDRREHEQHQATLS